MIGIYEAYSEEEEDEEEEESRGGGSCSLCCCGGCSFELSPWRVEVMLRPWPMPVVRGKECGIFKKGLQESLAWELGLREKKNNYKHKAGAGAAPAAAECNERLIL